MPLRFKELYRQVDPLVEPVTVGELKAQLRILHNDANAELGFLGVAAREWAEDFTNRSFIYQTWVALFDGWPTEDRVFLLPRPNLSVIDTLRYKDADDEWVELNEEEHFVVDEIANTVQLRQSFSIPTLSPDRAHPVEISFVSGFGTAAEDVPTRYKQAIKLCVASLYGKDAANDRKLTSFRAPSVAENLLATLRVRAL